MCQTDSQILRLLIKKRGFVHFVINLPKSLLWVGQDGRLLEELSNLVVLVATSSI